MPYVETILEVNYNIDTHSDKQQRQFIDIIWAVEKNQKKHITALPVKYFITLGFEGKELDKNYKLEKMNVNEAIWVLLNIKNIISIIKEKKETYIAFPKHFKL